MGAWVGFAGLLLGTIACADDQPGISSDASSSSGSSSSTAGVTFTGSGTAGTAGTTASADTTAGTGSTGGTTADGTSSSGPGTTEGSGSSSSSGSSGGSSGSTTREGTSSESGEGSSSSGGGPAACGDGLVQPGEQCDGGDFQGFDCVSLGFGPGLLFCDRVACTFDTSSCSAPGDCGNGAIDPGEQCDGADLQGFDCASLGLGGGTLGCDPVTCTFDTSLCGGMGNCGNGLINPGEQCDGANLQGFDCASLGLGGGMLACDPVLCIFDTSMCMPPVGGTSG